MDKIGRIDNLYIVIPRKYVTDDRFENQLRDHAVRNGFNSDNKYVVCDVTGSYSETAVSTILSDGGDDYNISDTSDDSLEHPSQLRYFLTVIGEFAVVGLFGSIIGLELIDILMIIANKFNS